MKHILLTFLMLILISAVPFAQETDDAAPVLSPLTVAFTYGFSTKNLQGANIDFHTQVEQVDNNGVAMNSNQYQQSSEAMQPFTEMLATFTIRPLRDYRFILLRVGMIQDAYKFSFAADEVNSSSITTGTMRTEIKERYIVYPLSVGFGVSTPYPILQLQAEFIYAPGFMDEEYTVTFSDGTKRSFTSTSYQGIGTGYRFGGQLNLHLGKTVSLHCEGGYRGLGFYFFKNRTTNKEVNLEYTASGAFFNGGIAVDF
ncbi:MAG: hypothetical protein WCW35_02580 [Bacteroidota bacterium]